ncbi:unnamed protein product [Larinioides sclopetarius]|uniref:Uncharacterized protein n=1 Tax=Larinioides sclopetarius TaxID=280406 RepID=A0AAV1ZVE6_9ARAC
MAKSRNIFVCASYHFVSDIFRGSNLCEGFISYVAVCPT